MVQTIAANTVTLRDLKDALGLQQVQDPAFFSEWQGETAELNEAERYLLDRVKANFTICSIASKRTSLH